MKTRFPFLSYAIAPLLTFPNMFISACDGGGGGSVDPAKQAVVAEYANELSLSTASAAPTGDQFMKATFTGSTNIRPNLFSCVLFISVLAACGGSSSNVSPQQAGGTQSMSVPSATENATILPSDLFVVSGYGADPLAQKTVSKESTPKSLQLSDAIDSMSLPSEAMVIDPRFDWQYNPKVTMHAPRGDAIPSWWTGNRPTWTSAVLSWFTAFEAQGNKAVNTRVQLKDLRFYVLSESTRTWTQVDMSAAPDLNLWKYPFDYAAPASGAGVRKESVGGISVKPKYPNFHHGWGSAKSINPQDVRAVFATIDFRLGVDDAAKADDRAVAKYVVDVGADYYPDMKLKWSLNYAPGVGNGRMLLATSDWRTATMLVPNKNYGSTMAEMKTNPPPLPASPPPAPVPTPPPATENFYVAQSGSDSGPGSKVAPFKTLARAVQAAVNPGTVVWVAPGEYAGGIKTTADGTETKRVTWMSTTKWGAKIVPPPESLSATAWDNRGDYVSIVGFDVDGDKQRAGKEWTHGIYTGGSHSIIRENHVHHIAQSIACNGAGGAAIGGDSYYQGVQHDIVANFVHDIGPAECKFVQGIYLSTSGTIVNNVVYRVAESAVHLWHDATDVLVANNTLAGSHYGIIVGGGDFYFNRSGNNNTTVANNIVYDNGVGIAEQGKTGASNRYMNNLVAKNGVAIALQNGLQASATVSSDPLFKEYASKTEKPNFRLSAGSPAIGRGDQAEAPATDIDGLPRDNNVDIGAHEFH